MDQETIIAASPLGDKSEYIDRYSTDLLFPIPREEPWRPSFNKRPFYGLDIWNAYEISWLDKKGLPQMALGEFHLPGDSPNIIESKSLSQIEGRKHAMEVMQKHYQQLDNLFFGNTEVTNNDIPSTETHTGDIIE